MARYNRFMGEYNENTPYEKGDVVTFDGAAYYRKMPGSGISPIARKKPYTVWSRLNEDLSTIFPLGGGGGTGTGLPSDVGAYKYMATDGSGEWQAVDRLGYKAVEKTELLPVKQYELQEGPTGYTAMLEIDSLIAGKGYLVSYNGLDYMQTAEAVEISGVDVVILGSSVQADGRPAWDLPFSVMYMPAANYVALAAQTNSATFGLWEATETIHPIPAEYIPTTRENVIFPATTIDVQLEQYFGYDYTFPAGTKFIAGKQYKVTYDGVSYVRTAYVGNDEGWMVAIGIEPGTNTEDPTLPFVIWNPSEEEWIFVDKNEAAGEHTLSVDEIVPLITPEMLPKPIPAEYIPRIVFTYDGTSYTCNVPYDEFEAAVMSGLPMSYVDKSDGLWVCTNIIVNEVGSGFEIFVYRSSGSEDIVLEYTSSGLNTVVDEA